MGTSKVKVKLKHGTASRIARRFKVTPHHVLAIIKGERPGRPALMKAIAREKERQAQEEKVA